MSSLTAPHAEAGASRQALGALAAREIRHYARHPLFLVGVAGTAAIMTYSILGPRDGTSSTMSMIVPAALLGLLGMITMSSLTRRSDLAAAAAGAPAAGEGVRTRALLAALVVPLTAATVWFLVALGQFYAQPPGAGAVPFGPLSDAHVLTVMFALSVVPALGGPLLGLLVARWLPRRGATPVAVVLLVIVTILLQGNFEQTWRWHVVWPWTYWYGPLGWSSTDTTEGFWVALPG
ncbi:MAG: hypothetical protein ACI379_13250, partial [Nocardioides sp.]|uniref:hypothetical protein n=1 Tax=Nocardioides sp. TaxID=35761 RepID=UPI003EFE106F